MATTNVSGTTTRSFKAAAARVKAAARKIGGGNFGRGLRMIGEEIMLDVKASRPGAGVPRDTGVLAGTGRVEGPVMVGKMPTVELSFGGAAADYALIQHEVLTYRHKVGEARYLVRGIERWTPDSSAAMAAIKANAAAGLRAAGGKI